MSYKFQCEDKYYKEWKVLHARDLSFVFDKNTLLEEKNILCKKFNNFDPVSLKLLNGDRFDVNEDNDVQVKHSIIKNMKQKNV